MSNLSIVVPCYNEENVVEIFYDNIIEVLKIINLEYELIFIDDGSKDNTFAKLKELREKNKNVKIINFSRNFGKESAIYAGLSNSTGELVAVMDADLQHPPKMLIEMLEGIQEGYDVVATKRKNRKGEPIFKSVFSKMFYRIMNYFLPMQQGVQDFRIMKRSVVDAILSLREYNRFSKGIFSWVGFNIKYIEIENIERIAGNTKWSFRKLVHYAIEGITSFTTAPLKISTIFGIIVSTVSIVIAIIILLQTLIFGKDVPGYASIITSVLFMGGIQLVSIGILSEYISKMYLEVKNRPKYIIKEKDF